MPQNRKQGLIFGILMSVTMAYGMEVYNVAWKMGIPTMPGGFSNLTNGVFLAALAEASYMWLFVLLFSSLWGTRGGAALARRIVDPARDGALVQGVARSCCTVLVMCPTMSLVASILFNVVLGGMPSAQLPAIWVGTVIKNFPWRSCGTSLLQAPCRALCSRSTSRTWASPRRRRAPCGGIVTS